MPLLSIANIIKSVSVGGCRTSESGHMQICELSAVGRTACPYQGGGFACRIGPSVLNTQSSRYYLHPGARRVTARSRESKLTAAQYASGHASAEVRPKRRPIACQPVLKQTVCAWLLLSGGTLGVPTSKSNVWRTPVPASEQRQS